ncbi:MAG: hypothetical protein Q9178_004206 [Gyalolechia marmorata]
MAFSTKSMYQRDPRWIWKLVVRVITIVVALIGLSCVAWVTDYLREWVNQHQGDEDRGYQSDIFILPWLLFTLCLSALWNTANILLFFFYSHPLLSSANIACDSLLILSLLASGIWLCLATTTNIDGTNALDIRLAANYSGASSRRVAVEILAICMTFTTA